MRIKDVQVGETLAVIGNGNSPEAEGVPYHMLRNGTEVVVRAVYPRGSLVPAVGVFTDLDVVHVEYVAIELDQYIQPDDLGPVAVH